MNSLIEIAHKSVEMEKMNPLELLVFLEGASSLLRNILDDDTSYSYDVYYGLLVLNHNFRTIAKPDYLKNGGEYSYFKKKIDSYYTFGGNRELEGYLLGLDSYQREDIYKTIKSGKQKFILSVFYKKYQGLPEELKHFCEVPDFYPEVTSDLIGSIIKKK